MFKSTLPSKFQRKIGNFSLVLIYFHCSLAHMGCCSLQKRGRSSLFPVAGSTWSQPALLAAAPIALAQFWGPCSSPSVLEIWEGSGFCLCPQVLPFSCCSQLAAGSLPLSGCSQEYLSGNRFPSQVSLSFKN